MVEPWDRGAIRRGCTRTRSRFRGPDDRIVVFKCGKRAPATSSRRWPRWPGCPPRFRPAAPPRFAPALARLPGGPARPLGAGGTAPPGWEEREQAGQRRAPRPLMTPLPAPRRAKLPRTQGTDRGRARFGAASRTFFTVSVHIGASAWSETHRPKGPDLGTSTERPSDRGPLNPRAQR